MEGGGGSKDKPRLLAGQGTPGFPSEEQEEVSREREVGIGPCDLALNEQRKMEWKKCIQHSFKYKTYN